MDNLFLDFQILKFSDSQILGELLSMTDLAAAREHQKKKKEASRADPKLSDLRIRQSENLKIGESENWKIGELKNLRI